MKPDLRSVPTDLPDPPYPADTKSNGYRIDVDWDRIRQSKTWRMADKDVRPWLLLLWIQSRENVPAGSWDDDEEYIAASIGCEFSWFQVHRKQLMRGWVLHSDGRLYHPYITAEVLKMRSARRNASERQNKRRNVTCESQHVTRDSHVTHALEQEQEQEQDIHPCISLSQHPVGISQTAPENGADSATSRRQPCPYSKILALWSETLPTLPQPVKLTEARKRQIRARWDDELPDLDAWRECFGYVRDSPFLTGKVDPPPGRQRFVATLDWVTKLDNLCKIYEGKYDGKARKTGPSS